MKKVVVYVINLTWTQHGCGPAMLLAQGLLCFASAASHDTHS